MEDRHHGIGFPCGLRDDRQGGIESRGSADRDGGQRPEPPGDKGCGQQREQLAHDIAEQCHRSQLRAPEIGDEDTRKRVVAEPSADGHRVPGRKRRQEQCRQSGAGQRTDGRHHGQQRQPRIEPPDTSREGRIVAEGDPHAKHQGIEHIGAEARPRHVERQGGGEPRQTSCDEKGDDHQTPPQGAPHRKRRVRPTYDVLPRNTPGVLSGTLHCNGRPGHSRTGRGRNARLRRLDPRSDSPGLFRHPFCGRPGCGSPPDAAPQQPRHADTARDRACEDDEGRASEGRHTTHDGRVGTDFQSQQEQQEPDNHGNHTGDEYEAPARQQAPRNDSSDDDGKNDKHRLFLLRREFFDLFIGLDRKFVGLFAGFLDQFVPGLLGSQLG